MQPADHLLLLEREGLRLAAMPVDALDAPVPNLADWNVERVVRHVGKIHQWVTGLVAAAPDADVGAVAAATKGIPRGPDCLPAYRESLDEVLDALRSCDPDRPTATFVGPDTARFWCRRQAHEVAVHRIDAADACHAAGGDAHEPIDDVGALDGIDEWCTVFVATRRRQTSGATESPLRRCTVAVRAEGGATLEARSWTLPFDETGLVPGVQPGNHSPDVTLRGPAPGVFLTCWRRRALATLDVSGDDELAETFIDTMRF
jgi:uncharacterized protein (TIGR03083 family)